MPYLVRALPLIRPMAEVEEFLATMMGERRRETDRFYAQFGVAHESVYLQETPHGPLLIVVTLIDDHHEAAPRYQAATEAFDTWFKQGILRLTGIDPNLQPLGPPTRCVLDWSAPAAMETGNG